MTFSSLSSYLHTVDTADFLILKKRNFDLYNKFQYVKDLSFLV